MGTTMARWQPLQRNGVSATGGREMIRERKLISPPGPGSTEGVRASSPTAAGKAKEVGISF